MNYPPQNSAKSEAWPSNDDICITGISGSFPESDSVQHLAENLFNKIDLVTDDDRRWKNTNPEISHRSGKINNIEKFDATFFDIDHKQAHTMDPMIRIVLERTYEAIIDAGYNPSELRGTSTGVFIGVCCTESDKIWCYEKMDIGDYKQASLYSRSMYATQISQWLGVSGPSYSVDTACSSSLFALEHAITYIRNQECDAAIVCGVNALMHPSTTNLFAGLGALSPDGISRSFDNQANGYVRSEAIAAVFLQKAKNSRRIYAQVVHAKTNCDGYKEQGITYPAGHIQRELLEGFYSECGVPPTSLEYVEAHGTGTQVGDLEELNAIDRIFCTDRTGPLLIGSVKSNLGHSEPTSGLCSIAKVCIAYHSCFIPPNINFTKPREEVAGLMEGRLKVVTEKTPWNRGMTGISSFGFGGANAHILLKNIARAKENNGLPADNLPRLVCVSGRTESAVAKILNDLETRTVDVDEIHLWHAIHEFDIAKHNFRGFVLLGSEPNKSVRLGRDIQPVQNTKKTVCFVYSGIDETFNWLAMAKQLMAIPAFASPIQKCHKALECKGFDLIKLINDGNVINKNSERYYLVGVIATQIALTDLLDTVNIKSDYVIGHGIGELLCAYVDGCLTLEQTVTASYSIVLALETVSHDIITVAVGLSCDKVKKSCPHEFDVTNHSSSDTCIVSGPADIIKTYVAKLTAEGITVDEYVTSNRFAYNSRHAVEVVTKLVQYLREVIPFAKSRSDRWVSTSVPQSQWKTEEALLSSAEYHANSLIVPVLFEESMRLLPSKTILVEVGPQTLLINHNLQKEAVNVPLMDQCNNLPFFFTALGKLFELGLNPHLAKIYPPVQFPVPQGTPMLAHLVEWEHSDSWTVVSFDAPHVAATCESTVKFSLQDEIHAYLEKHCIDGRVIYPATGYLLLAWKTLAQINAKHHWDMSVVFENVYFQRATNIPDDIPLEFTIVIHRGSGSFEITESGTSVVVGRIYEKKNVLKDDRSFPSITQIRTKDLYSITMSKRDFYKELSLRGYQHGGEFRGVLECSIDGTRGLLEFRNNWVTFIDTMLQVQIIAHDTRTLYIPTRIEKVSIDVNIHSNITSQLEFEETKSVPFQWYPEIEEIRCGGVEIRGVHTTAISKKSPRGIPVLEKNEFVPNFTDSIIPFTDSLRSNMQLILENISTYKLKIVELVDEEYKNDHFNPTIELVGEILNDIPLIQADLLVSSKDHLELPSNISASNKKISEESNVTLIVGANLLTRPKVLEQAASILKQGCFILSREVSLPSVQEVLSRAQKLQIYDIITTHHTESEYLVLLRKKTQPKLTKYIEILTTDLSYSWIDKIKEEMDGNNKIVIYSQNECHNGLLGFVNCLLEESGGDIVKGLLIADSKAPKFNPDCHFYKEQLEKDLTMNVYKNGQWGTYRHLLLKDLDIVPATHAYVNTTTIGDLKSLRWYQGAIANNEPTPKGATNVHVYCSAINFRDVMTAMGHVTVDAVARGRLAQECVQGIEISGRTPCGHRIMAICVKGISNMVQVDETLLLPFPDEWTFEEAATIPIAYKTVYLALVMIGKIRRGESILIHAGSGAVGQAAINVALHHGLKIFTTVSTHTKRAFIKRLFPQIKDSHIGNSRDTSFEHMICRETNGKGVDVVLNSLADNKLQASAKCLTRRGRFLEIGKYDITVNTEIEMCFVNKEISFHGIMLDHIYDENSLALRLKLRELILKGILTGAVRPLTRCIFEKTEIETAYRYMAASKHIGKVIVKIREGGDSSTIKPSPCIINAIPRYTCNKDDVYVLIGGMGGFGLELADWLVLRGARKIVMSSRRGISNGYQAYRLRVWASYGTEVHVSTHDVTTEKGCEDILKIANAIGPVKAIFNLAVILKDAVFKNQTPETFKTSFGPKGSVAINLDKLSRTMCPHLQDFVVFSSVSCGRGNAGQTNYGYSNSVMERICEDRKDQGLPALAIQWGAIGDVGLVADMQADNEQLEIGGTLQQRISSCLQALDKFLKQDAPVVSSMVVVEKRTSKSSTGNIVDVIAAILGIPDLKTVSHQVTLSELGMDSIMAVEIKQTLNREFEIFLAPEEIRNLTFAKLLELAARRNAESDANGSLPPKATAATASAAVPAGLGLLIRNLGNEDLAYKHFIDMPSLATEKLKNNQSTTTIFMVPGLEGSANSLEPLCSKLNSNTCVLQLGLDNPLEDIHQMTDKLFKIVQSRLDSNTPFCLLGYSFGTLPILNLASKLESKGHPGVVFCLDGSPVYVQSMASKILDCTNDFTMQTSIILKTMNLFLKTNVSDDILTKFDSSQTVEEQVKIAMDLCPPSLTYSRDFLIKMCVATVTRLQLALAFKQSEFKKLKSPIILLRPKKSLSYVSDCDEQYSLHLFTEGEVSTHYFEADHVSILENMECAETINRILSKLNQDAAASTHLKKYQCSS